jgi:hypothetical protein
MDTGSKSSISEIREELEKLIKESLLKTQLPKKGFIFFIDDLDRMDPPTAVQLLELLKNIFTLEHCVFVLAIDYDVVIKGLEPKFGKLSEQNEREFRSFFDKIIQVPFSMPVAKYEIEEFLKKSLLSIHYIDNKQAENTHFIKNISEISNLSVGTNPRSLKRLLNSLSLIKCINAGKSIDMDPELFLLTNFTLVSIQVAYPSVYRLLEKYPDFDQWDEDIAIEENLSQLNEQNVLKLSHSEEFSAEWEKVLFRFCEKEHYLKKRVSVISRLLNKLKDFIEEKKVDIEDVVSKVISLSSITNVDSGSGYEKTITHRTSDQLKEFRDLLIEQLKEIYQSKDKRIVKFISPQGRVQTKASIKFSRKVGDDYLRLSFQPKDEECMLRIDTEKKLIRKKTPDSFKDCVRNTGLITALEDTENDFRKIEQNTVFSDVEFSDLEYKTDGSSNKYVAKFSVCITLPEREDFWQEDTLRKLTILLSELHQILVRFNELTDNINKEFKQNKTDYYGLI